MWMRGTHTPRNFPSLPNVSPETRRSDHDELALNARDDAADRALANALPQIIWTCDAQGQLDWVNDRWFELTGMSAKRTLTDKGALDAVHADDRDDVARHWGHALETSTQAEFEYRIRNKERRVSVASRAHFAGPRR